jgi:hypothetical protein
MLPAMWKMHDLNAKSGQRYGYPVMTARHPPKGAKRGQLRATRRPGQLISVAAR